MGLLWTSASLSVTTLLSNAVLVRCARTSRSATSFLAVALIGISLLLAGCGGKKSAKVRVPAPPTIGVPTSPGESTEATRKSSNDPLAEIDPKAPAIWTQTGMASWYGPPYHNRQSANGEIFDTNAMTAAHKTLPMNSIVRVTNLKTSHSAIVRINDRGPFVGDRIIDLSKAAAQATDVYRAGLAKVRVDVLKAPSAIEKGGRWCVQVGAFTTQKDALQLKDKLQRRYHTAKILQFPGPTGYWVRVRVLEDDKKRAQEVASVINVNEGGVFLVRLD